MRVIIEKGETGLYLSNSGEWTPDRKQALCFAEVTTAIDYVFNTGLNGVRPVVTHAASGWLFRLPGIFRQRVKSEATGNAVIS